MGAYMDMSDEPTEFRAHLGRRIAAVAALYPTKAAAAEAAGISAEQLNKWIAGTVKVPIEGLRGLSQAVDVDFCWLCNGPRDIVVIRSTAGRPFQEAVLRDVLVALADVIASDGVTFHPERFADLTFDLHDYVIERRAKDGAAAADLEGIAHFIKAAARSRR